MMELTRAERLKAMAFPEPNYWVGVACIVGFIVSVYAAKRFEAKYRHVSPGANQRQQGWLEAQRLLVWGAVIYFGFVAFWAFIAFAMKLLLSIPWWGYLIIILITTVAYIRGWIPGWSLEEHRAERARSQDDESM
ncbi:MAG: hypothetical protein VKN33_05210 [Candidatus Sericytochromatia bacterium]|nr:hypothetical protein [Candidatus Sericytochromatia bacterium]